MIDYIYGGDEKEMCALAKVRLNELHSMEACAVLIAPKECDGVEESQCSYKFNKEDNLVGLSSVKTLTDIVFVGVEKCSLEQIQSIIQTAKVVNKNIHFYSTGQNIEIHQCVYDVADSVRVLASVPKMETGDDLVAVETPAEECSKNIETSID